MVTCPNCGTSVRAGQRFCGNCGTDVQAAMSASTPRASEPPRSSETPDMPYAYSQPSGGYAQQGGGYAPSGGYGQSSSSSSSNYDYGNQSLMGGSTPPGRMIIIAGALILAVCCAFACGLVFGFEIIPDILGIGGAAAPTPALRPTVIPTPSTMLPLLHLLIG